MRIQKKNLNNVQMSCFNTEFRKLYGNFFSDIKIENILEENKFVLVAIAPVPEPLTEVDIITEHPENFGVALKEEGLKLRFEVLKTGIPGKNNKINYFIDGFSAILNISKFEFLDETFRFYILTSINNPLDSKFTCSFIKLTDEKKKFNHIIEFLKELIAVNDSRKNYAEDILRFFGETD